MKQLSIGVAIAAAIALVAGITKGGVDVLGLAADPTLLSIGAVRQATRGKGLQGRVVRPGRAVTDGARRRPSETAMCRSRTPLAREPS